MKKTILLLILLFVFLLSPSPASAAVSVTLRLDRQEATLMDTITMVVKISGIRSVDSGPILNGLDSFDVKRGGTSSRVEINNGKVNAGIDYTYAIQPKKTGTFKIGPVKVTVKGKTIRSNTETLTIVEPNRASGVNRGPLFLCSGLSSQELYVEEQAVYTLKLYRQVRVSDISLDLPATEHMTFKQLAKPVEYQGLYNGQPYQILEVRYALTPSREGTYGIRPSRMNMAVYQSRQRSRRGLFDDPFSSFSSSRPKTVASEPLELTVLPLPDEGRPADFSGLVGTFQINSKLEPSEIKAGESATLTVILSGLGNVKRIPDLEMPKLQQTKIYADQPVLKEETDAKGLSGSKTMKWALVPEKEGRYQVPPLSVSFFDTASHQYRVIRTSPLTLSVLPDEKKQVLASAGGTKEQGSGGPVKQKIKEIGHDILPVHTSVKGFTTGYRVRTGGLVFWVVLLAPFFVYMATFWALKIGRKSDRAMAAARARRAAGQFTNQCRQGRSSASETILLIRDYMNDRFGLSLGSLTPDEAAGILKLKGVSHETADEMRNLIQKHEDAIYTGKGDDPYDVGQAISKFIKKIEKEIR